MLNIQGFNVELTDGIDDEDPNMMMLKRLVQLDGEMFELKAPSFQLRYR